MSTTDIDPCEGTLKLENEKFARNSSGKTVVRVADDETLAILEDILLELGGNPSGTKIHEKSDSVTTPGVEQTLISFTVGAGLTRQISKVRVTCRQSIQWRLFVGGTDEASGRIGAGILNDDFKFDVTFDVSAGTLVELKAIQDTGPATDIEAYIQAVEV